MSSIHPDTAQFNYPLYAAGADTLTYLEGSISDGSGPIHNYQDNTHASWLIDPQTMYDSVTNITIMVKKLDIFNDGDKLSIYDGEDNTAPLIAEITGNEIPEDMVSSSNKVFIEFISNGTNTAPGFYLNYNCDQPVWCMGYTEITEPQGTINDGSGNFYYNNGSSCIWMIDPGLNQPLYLDFNYFNTENNSDVFSVYDGETQELLGEFSGDYQAPNLPPIVVSNSGKLFITFQTNSNVRNEGWEINYGIYTGFNEYQHGFAFKLIPNPTNDKTTIDFVFETGQEAFLTVLNTNAQILKKIYLGKKDSGTYELNCTSENMAIFNKKSLNMLRTIIIDDEAHMRQTLEKMVRRFCPDLNIVATADGVKAGIDAIQKHNPDLVLLDIKLDDGTGFNILEELEPVDFKVIFVTAYDQYAIKAFKFSAIDYILKPVDPDELVEAVRKTENILQNDFNTQLDTLKENFNGTNPCTYIWPVGFGGDGYFICIGLNPAKQT